mmetsp:Transcript_38445/g.65684  ORF Transcript_38445/g.65684 Transcript_38445/m.65684 type:complete len:315 (-) Transcript_38445:165-1109(-)
MASELQLQSKSKSVRVMEIHFIAVNIRCIVIKIHSIATKQRSATKKYIPSTCLSNIMKLLIASVIAATASFAASQQCKNNIVPQVWQSMEECCPCVTERTCELLFGNGTVECRPGMDCYKTAMLYPESISCEAELSFYHWMHDPDSCSYSYVDGEYVVNALDFEPLSQACSIAFGNDGGCGFIGGRELLDESRPHHRRVMEEEDGLTLHAESHHEERLLWLNDHVAEMQQRVETGDAPRAWDPLFKAYFANLEDINLECSSSDNSVSCKSTGSSQCALDLIQAHASYHNEIAASIKENGDHIITAQHAIPDSCM